MKLIPHRLHKSRMSLIPPDLSDVPNSSFPNISMDRFQCQSSVSSWVMTALMILDYCLSLPTLPWALGILIRNSALETDLFIFNILCTDLLATLLSPVLLLVMSLSSFRSVFIQVLFLLNHVYLTGSPMVQCGMCLERYVAVVHPVLYLRYKGMRYKLTGLTLIWVTSLLMSLIDFILLKSHLLLAILILVVAIQMFFSVSILRVLNRSGPGDGKRQQENDGKRRAFLTVLLIQLKLLFNYMPYILMSMLQEAFSEYLYHCYVLFITINVCSFGHFFQAFLYLQKVGKFSAPKSEFGEAKLWKL